MTNFIALLQLAAAGYLFFFVYVLRGLNTLSRIVLIFIPFIIALALVLTMFSTVTA